MKILTSVIDFIEINQDALLRSLLLLLGSSITLIFLLTLFQIHIIESPEHYSNLDTFKPVSIASTKSPLQIHNPVSNTTLSAIEPLKTTFNVSTPLLPDGPLVIQKTLSIGAHENFKVLLARQGVLSADINKVWMLPQAFLILSKLSKNHTLTLTINQHLLERLEYKINNSDNLIIQRHGNEFSSYLLSKNVEERIINYSGTIHHPVVSSLVSSGLTQAQYLTLHSLFQNEVDLNQLPLGSHFKIVLDETYVKGHKHSNSVIAAQFKTPEKTFTILKDPNSSHFYRANGDSLEKAFMRAPLHYDHISSPFNLHRLQPILHIIRPHYGVDFAAPYGSKVMAASDGVITYAGYENGYGNVIKIRFNSEYSTLYGHLSRFSEGIHSGKHVKEGEVIGYVGSSGLSTGAHLHYELHINGQPFDPLSAKLPSGYSLSGRDRNIFNQFEKRIL